MSTTSAEMVAENRELGTINVNGKSDTPENGEKRLPFPIKVYEMLEDAEEKGFADVVSWNAEGTGFMVWRKDQFINDIAPNYFNQSKYKSFQVSRYFDFK